MVYHILIVMWYYWGLQTNQLNVTVHNLRRFRVSSKHVAGSISEGVMCLTLMLGRCLSKFSLTSPLPHMSSVHPMPFAPCRILMRYRTWCKPRTLEVDIASTLQILHVTWYHDDFGVANLEGEWEKKLRNCSYPLQSMREIPFSTIKYQGTPEVWTPPPSAHPCDQWTRLLSQWLSWETRVWK